MNAKGNNFSWSSIQQYNSDEESEGNLFESSKQPIQHSSKHQELVGQYPELEDLTSDRNIRTSDNSEKECKLVSENCMEGIMANNSEDKWDQHICEVCFEAFESFQQLILHSAKHPELFARYPQLKELISENDKNECDKVQDYREGVQLSISANKQNVQLVAEHSSPSSNDPPIQNYNSTISEQYMCEVCSKLFESSHQLILHSVQHPELVAHYPELKKFVSGDGSRDLTQVSQGITSEENELEDYRERALNCGVCSKILKSVHELNVHLSVEHKHIEKSEENRTTHGNEGSSIQECDPRKTGVNEMNTQWSYLVQCKVQNDGEGSSSEVCYQSFYSSHEHKSYINCNVQKDDIEEKTSHIKTTIDSCSMDGTQTGNKKSMTGGLESVVNFWKENFDYIEVNTLISASEAYKIFKRKKFPQIGLLDFIYYSCRIERLKSSYERGTKTQFYAKPLETTSKNNTNIPKLTSSIPLPELNMHSSECHVQKDDIEEKTSHIKTTDQSCAMDGTQTGEKRKMSASAIVINFWEENFDFTDKSTQISAVDAYEMFFKLKKFTEIGLLDFISYSRHIEHLYSCKQGNQTQFYAKALDTTSQNNIKKPKLTSNIPLPELNTHSLECHVQKDDIKEKTSHIKTTDQRCAMDRTQTRKKRKITTAVNFSTILNWWRENFDFTDESSIISGDEAYKIFKMEVECPLLNFINWSLSIEDLKSFSKKRKTKTRFFKAKLLEFIQKKSVNDSTMQEYDQKSGVNAITQSLCLDEHRKEGIDESPFRCDVCSQSFPSAFELNIHYIECDVCYITFHTVRELNKHSVACHRPKDDTQMIPSLLNVTQTDEERQKTNFETLVNFWKENNFHKDLSTQISAAGAYNIFKTKNGCSKIGLRDFITNSCNIEDLEIIYKRETKTRFFLVKPFKNNEKDNIQEETDLLKKANHNSTMQAEKKYLNLSSAFASLIHQGNPNVQIAYIPEELQHYKCEVCSELFETAQKMLSHCVQHPELVIKFPGLKEFKCSEPLSTKKMKYDTSNDVNTTSSTKQLNCQFGCGHVFTSEELLKKHKEIYHKNKKGFKCPECHKFFLQKEGMTSHRKTHKIRNCRSANKIICYLCNRAFNSQGLYKKHNEMNHQVQKGPLPSNEMNHQVQKGPLPSIDEQANQEELKCAICQIVFEEKTKLTNHRKTCGKEKSIKLEIKVEMLHCEDQPLECAQCHEWFPDIKLLSLHHFVHEKEKLWPGNFPTESVNSIDSHLHKCEYCHRVFNHKGQLKTHENRIHDRVRSRSKITQFYCAKCNTYFPTLKLLTANVLDHEKKFQPRRNIDLERTRCIACNEIFIKVKCLAHHESICHPNLQIECEVEGCHFTFKHKHDMLVHKSTHITERVKKVKEAKVKKYEEEQSQGENSKCKSKEFISDSDLSSQKWDDY